MLKMLLELTDPTFYKDWTVFDEYFRKIIPKQDRIQPYFYWVSPEIVSSKINSIFIYQSIEDDVYMNKLQKQPKFLLFSKNKCDDCETFTEELSASTISTIFKKISYSFQNTCTNRHQGKSHSYIQW